MQLLRTPLRRSSHRRDSSRREPAHDNEERWTDRRAGRELDALEIIAEELKRLRVLKEHELGVRLEHTPDAGGPYVPEAEK